MSQWIFLIPVLLIAFHHVSGARLSLGLGKSIENSESDGKRVSNVHVETNSHRLLPDEDVIAQCESGQPGALHYLSLSIDVIPEEGGSEVVECTDSMKQSINETINMVLLDFSPGAEGANLTAAVVLWECPQPTSDRRRAASNVLNFVWKGGGTCRQCNPEGSDGRRLGESGVWVRRTLIPELETSLTNAIIGSIVVSDVPCLGSTPKVNVTAHVATKTALEMNC